MEPSVCNLGSFQANDAETKWDETYSIPYVFPQTLNKIQNLLTIQKLLIFYG